MANLRIDQKQGMVISGNADGDSVNTELDFLHQRANDVVNNLLSTSGYSLSGYFFANTGTDFTTSAVTWSDLTGASNLFTSSGTGFNRIIAAAGSVAGITFTPPRVGLVKAEVVFTGGNLAGTASAIQYRLVAGTLNIDSFGSNIGAGKYTRMVLSGSFAISSLSSLTLKIQGQCPGGSGGPSILTASLPYSGQAVLFNVWYID